MRDTHHEYNKTYSRKLDELCSEIGINSKTKEIIDTEQYNITRAETINNKLLEMFHAGQTFGYKYRTQNRTLLEEVLDADKIPVIRIYQNTNETNEDIATAKDVIVDMHTAFIYGCSYSLIFKKRMNGREFLEGIDKFKKYKIIYKLQKK